MLLARSLRSLLASLLILTITHSLSASAFIRGAYYRLGDDDGSASATATGNNPTEDSFTDALDLTRYFYPRYSADVPTFGPTANKLSMSFVNNNPIQNPGYYGRAFSLEMIQQGHALEAWVKSADFLAGPGPAPDQLIAYNGDPTSNGFGFYRDGQNYIARISTFERILGPAGQLQWHHLAYVQSLGTSSYYYDGKLIHETSTDPLPTSATGGFWLAGRSTTSGDTDLFTGLIDEVRYQSFNPMAAGAFEPTNFLITPEPASLTLLLLTAVSLLHRRARL